MVVETAQRLSHALIIDDHPLFCDALSMTLQSIPGVQSVKTVHLLQDGLDALSTLPQTDVVMLDLNLPDVSGLDGLVRLKKAAQDVPIIVVSSLADQRMIKAVLQAGAQGFVPKHSKRDVFLSAFAKVGAGERYHPDGYVDVPGSADDGSERKVAFDRLATLTNQQARILHLICEGKLNKQIAYDLSIAETTVKAHVTAIMRKLGVQSRTQAVLIAGQARFSNILPSEAS
ncbi:MAG: response regulator transcription factor [Pseudomonadota bacterium]